MTAPAGSGFSLSGAVTQTSATQNPTVGFGFGSTGISAQSTPMPNPPASSSAPTFGAFAAATSAAPSTTTAAPGFSFLSTSSAAPTTSTNLVSSAAQATPAAGLTFGAGVTPLSGVKKNVTFNLCSPAATTTVPTLTLAKGILKSSTPVSGASTVAVSATSGVTPGSGDQPVNYVQLQDLTSKWINDFEELQKLLLNQTAETINRDVILASNEDKIEKLVGSVQNLKSEQTIVEQQLDFILSQQKDLEECLASLEDEVSSYFPELPADDVYKLAENIDSRLKKTLETSKEIINKLNDKNRVSENVANPMVAIGRILNHHTNSIQMLENMNAEGQTKLNDLQKLYQQYTA